MSKVKKKIVLKRYNTQPSFCGRKYTPKYSRMPKIQHSLIDLRRFTYYIHVYNDGEIYCYYKNMILLFFSSHNMWTFPKIITFQFFHNCSRSDKLLAIISSAIYRTIKKWNIFGFVIESYSIRKYNSDLPVLESCYL